MFRQKAKRSHILGEAIRDKELKVVAETYKLLEMIEDYSVKAGEIDGPKKKSAETAREIADQMLQKELSDIFAKQSAVQKTIIALEGTE